MMTKWQEHTLGDLCAFKYGQMPKKTDLCDDGYPVFSGYRIVGNARTFHYEEPEIIVVARGVGGTGDVKMSPPKCFLTNLSIVAKIASPEVEKKFLYYRLAGPKLWELRTGSAQAQITIDRLKRYELRLPSLATQRKIAAVLSAYDDLIENNLRRIKILEAMAQNLYREWFVKFRFPGHQHAQFVDSPLGPIPEGWEVGRLDDLLVLQRGFDLPTKNRTHGDYVVYAASGPHGFHNEYKAKGPGVVTGRSGTIGVVTYVEGEYWPLNTTLWVKEFKRCTPLFAFYVISEIDFEQFRSGAAVPTLNRNHVHGLPVVLPPLKMIEEFQAHAGPLNGLVRSLNNKNANLRQTRDLLLPKLISGELDVSELDIALPEQAVG